MICSNDLTSDFFFVFLLWELCFFSVFVERGDTLVLRWESGTVPHILSVLSVLLISRICPFIFNFGIFYCLLYDLSMLSFIWIFGLWRWRAGRCQGSSAAGQSESPVNILDFFCINWMFWPFFCHESNHSSLRQKEALPCLVLLHLSLLISS